MNRHAIGAFLATIGVAVPAGWHLIDADLHTDGKHVRNLQQSMALDDATVTFDVDRAIVQTGDRVTATMVATAPTAKDIKLEITVYTEDDTPGERVGPTPRAVDHENITVHAAPGGGKPFTTQIRLGSTKMTPGRVNNYRIFLSPRHTTLAKGNAMEGMGYPSTEEGAAAGVSVLAWSGDTMGMRIEPRPPKTPDDPFVVAVHIKNPDKAAIKPYVSLGTQLSDYGVAYTTTEDQPKVSEMTDDETGDADIAPHGERVYLFQVEPTGPARDIPFIAYAHLPNDGMGVRPTGGAMDVKVIHLPAGAADQPAPTVAGK